jgi:hypothetical protein
MSTPTQRAAPEPTEAHSDESKPFKTPEDLDFWLNENRKINSQWTLYNSGVAHGENEQHGKSYSLGYKDGWRDARLQLNDLSAPASREASLRDALSYSRFEHVLLAHGLVQRDAVEHPDGYDNYVTHGAMHAAHRELIALAAHQPSAADESRAQLAEDLDAESRERMVGVQPLCQPKPSAEVRVLEIHEMAENLTPQQAARLAELRTPIANVKS